MKYLLDVDVDVDVEEVGSSSVIKLAMKGPDQ